MQRRTPWLAILLMFLTVMLAACGDDDSPRNPPRDGSPAKDSAMGASCPGMPSIGCEVVVDDVDDCPGLEEICDSVCGAAHECCYCGDDGQWRTLYTDCPQCIDAGMDAF
jgi:hypothetical protein